MRGISVLGCVAVAFVAGVCVASAAITASGHSARLEPPVDANHVVVVLRREGVGDSALTPVPQVDRMLALRDRIRIRRGDRLEEALAAGNLPEVEAGARLDPSFCGSRRTDTFWVSSPEAAFIDVVSSQGVVDAVWGRPGNLTVVENMAVLIEGACVSPCLE